MLQADIAVGYFNYFSQKARMLIENKEFNIVMDLIQTIQSKGETSVLLLVKKLRYHVDLRHHISGNDELLNNLQDQLECGENVEHPKECCNDLEYVVGKFSGTKGTFKQCDVYSLCTKLALRKKKK